VSRPLSQLLSRLLSQNPSRFDPGEISSIWHSEWKPRALWNVNHKACDCWNSEQRLHWILSSNNNAQMLNAQMLECLFVWLILRVVTILGICMRCIKLTVFCIVGQLSDWIEEGLIVALKRNNFWLHQLVPLWESINHPKAMRVWWYQAALVSAHLQSGARVEQLHWMIIMYLTHSSLEHLLFVPFSCDDTFLWHSSDKALAICYMNGMILESWKLLLKIFM